MGTSNDQFLPVKVKCCAAELFLELPKIVALSGIKIACSSPAAGRGISIRVISSEDTYLVSKHKNFHDP